MSAFEGALRKQHSVISDNTYPITPDSSEAADQRLSIILFEFLEPTSVNDASYNLSYVILPSGISWYDSVDFFRVV